jgi:opacity protein-like surface antigen
MLYLKLLIPLISTIPVPEGTAIASPPLASIYGCPVSDSNLAQDTADTELSSGGWYARLSGGLVTTKDTDGPGNEKVEFDEGFLLGAALGQRVTSDKGPFNLDVDVEALWTQQDASTSGALQAVDDVTVLAGLLNLTLNYSVAPRAAIYLGGGVGAAWMDVGTGSGFADDDGPFLAWQARTGLEWRFAPSFAATVGYRLLNIDDNNIDSGIGNSSFDLETQQHALEIGLRVGI